jgi:lipid-A-disaccharide synthase
VTARESGEQLLVVAGEASGDTHAAELLRELARRCPGLKTFGLGGGRCAAAGLERLAKSSEISVVGITEAVRILPRALKIFRLLLAEVDRRGARTALLVDFPEFNLRLAKALAKRGVRVVYYVSPQVWAWRRGRVKAIARVVDEMLVLFPFEKAFYRAHGIEAVHVGHPLVDQVPMLDRLPVSEGGRRTVCLLPGSRSSEVRVHLPIMSEAVRLLAERIDLRVRWIVPPELHLSRFEPLAPSELDLEVVSEGRFEAIAAADLALCASGTATLEVGLLGTPMIVVYKVSRLTALVGRALIKLPSISLVNLVLERPAVPELLQEAATAQGICSVAEELLSDPERLRSMIADLAELRTRLGESGASSRAAAVVERVLQGEKGQVDA